MILSTTVLIDCEKAGQLAAATGNHTCAGTDPIFLKAITGIEEEFVTMVKAWDSGYFSQRALILATANSNDSGHLIQ